MMQFHHLRYKFELALAGMADGTLLASKRPPRPSSSDTVDLSQGVVPAPLDW